MKKGLGIFGIGLIAGAVIYLLLNKSKKSKDDSATSSVHEIVDAPPYHSVSIIDKNDIHDDGVELENVKSSTINTMSIRHEEASKIMEDAVEIICKRSKVTENENRDLEQISDELDELLSEE